MSQIIDIILVNSTNSVWEKKSSTSNYVDISNFTNSISPKRNKRFSISTDESNGIINCSFDVEYKILNSENNTFRIRGNYKSELNRLDLEIFLENLETHNHKKNSTISLGWETEGVNECVFIGDVGNYIGPDIDTQSWMQEYRNILGDTPIQNLCITGSHDAGMYKITWKTGLASECNTLTQSNNIFEQLKLGIRYFDIRPTLSDGSFYTGHFNKTIVWEGANGDNIQSIIDQINVFTTRHNELILIRLDHSLNLDTGFWFSYIPFKQKEWMNLFKELEKINHLYYHDGTSSILDLTLNQLTDNGTHSAVLFLVENKKTSVNLGGYHNKGFFYLSELNMYHKYSNTDSSFQMGSDQFKKMNDYAPTQYFQLSWILTQNFIQITTCATGVSNSIRQLAEKAHDTLTESLYPQITATKYPNIILIDNVKNKAATTLALAINWTVLSYNKE
ncbi:hypothetical protein [Xenorhabdus sp. PB62.4]|uniref:hypothetical protein n=1 Tax=Xenorhabdus sp. PB62.4 TaxID=1851573 RepID=UPI0016574290|nr:hypothetical protein [Xenorhabdus sp. PB62.4]MBC8953347.1 RHS repeat-associated core domain-containing protein [Xenorhabdus sp. PB62.4]